MKEAESATLGPEVFPTISAGRQSATEGFISVRQIEGCDITLTDDTTGSLDLPAGGIFRLIMGAQSGSAGTDLGTQGFFGEYRNWGRQLSGSEIVENLPLKMSNESDSRRVSLPAECDKTTLPVSLSKLSRT